MSQNDFTIANQSFPAFRADLNSALQALASNNSGDTEPSTTFANMWWYDSANNIMYIRNEDNDAWIKFAELDQANDKFVLSGTLQLDDGTVSAPALTFNSDTNMGIYRGGTDILKFVTAGADRLTIDASGIITSEVNGAVRNLDLNNEADTPFMTFSESGAVNFFIGESSVVGGGVGFYDLYATSGLGQRFFTNALRRMQIESNGNIYLGYEDTGSTPKLFWDASAESLGIGLSNPTSQLTVGGNASTTYTPTVAITDTTSGATLSMRGQSPKIAFDVTASGVPKILMDNAGLEFKTGTLDDEGDVDLKIDSFGNVGIGTSSPDTNLDVEGAGDCTISITAGSTSHDSKIDFVHGSTIDGGITFDHNGTFSSEQIQFRVGNNTAHVIMHGTGATSFGTNDASPYIGTEGFIVALNDASRYGAIFGCNNIANREAVVFVNPNGAVGSIRTNGSSTSFNESSDYRLKENVEYDWDATTRLKQLKPARFNFIADADTTVDGFLAHEVSSVVPEAVSGTHNEVEVWKDGEELPDGVSVGDNKLDDDGNTIPKYQGIDKSKLVPLLVKTIQELEARITALENGE